MFEDAHDPSLFKMNPMRSFVNSGPVFQFYLNNAVGSYSTGQLNREARLLAQFCFEMMARAGLWQYRASRKLPGYPASLEVSVIAVPNGEPLVRAWVSAVGVELEAKKEKKIAEPWYMQFFHSDFITLTIDGVKVFPPYHDHPYKFFDGWRQPDLVESYHTSVIDVVEGVETEAKLVDKINWSAHSEGAGILLYTGKGNEIRIKMLTFDQISATGIYQQRLMMYGPTYNIAISRHRPERVEDPLHGEAYEWKSHNHIFADSRFYGGYFVVDPKRVLVPWEDWICNRSYYYGALRNHYWKKITLVINLIDRTIRAELSDCNPLSGFVR